MISFTIRASFLNNNLILSEFPFCYKWTDNAKSSFQAPLNLPVIQNLVSKLMMDLHCTDIHINSCLSQLTEIYIRSASLSLKWRQNKRGTKRNIKPLEDSNLKKMRMK